MVDFVKIGQFYVIVFSFYNCLPISSVFMLVAGGCVSHFSTFVRLFYVTESGHVLLRCNVHVIFKYSVHFFQLLNCVSRKTYCFCSIVLLVLCFFPINSCKSLRNRWQNENSPLVVYVRLFWLCTYLMLFQWYYRVAIFNSIN